MCHFHFGSRCLPHRPPLRRPTTDNRSRNLRCPLRAQCSWIADAPASVQSSAPLSSMNAGASLATSNGHRILPISHLPYPVPGRRAPRRRRSAAVQEALDPGAKVSVVRAAFGGSAAQFASLFGDSTNEAEDGTRPAASGRWRGMRGHRGGCKRRRRQAAAGDGTCGVHEAKRRAALFASSDLQGSAGQSDPSPSPPTTAAAASLDAPLAADNLGRQLLQRMGWRAGQGLGARRQGRVDPVPVRGRPRRAGLGHAAPCALPGLEAVDGRRRSRVHLRFGDSSSDEGTQS